MFEGHRLRCVSLRVRYQDLKVPEEGYRSRKIGVGDDKNFVGVKSLSIGIVYHWVKLRREGVRDV